ncbi:DmX-like protein [Dirofilaria immitis]
MNVHQILTGALNRGDEVFSVGAIDDLSFTACAVGTNVVIFSSSFERVQVITPASCTERLLVKCVAACCETGKIVATYSGLVRIYEPIMRTENGINGFTFNWVETYNFPLRCSAKKIQWSLQGLRLLICCGDELHLYQNLLLSAALDAKADTVTFGIVEEENESESEGIPSWDCVWSQKLAAKLKFMASSPDGAYFATCGVSDCLVKIWFQREESDNVGNNENGISFDFIYVQHPQPVAGFEWRKVPRYMSRQYVQNALLTWCEDSTVRIWKEAATGSLDFQTVISTAEVAYVEKSPTRKPYSKKHSFRGTRAKIKTFLKKIMEKKAFTGETMRSVRSFSRNTSLCEIASGKHTDSNLVFYLCTTINAQNDCLLVPSLETSSEQGPFMIHWLNNKEIVYDIGIERIMIEALFNDRSTESSETENLVGKSVLQTQNLLTESLYTNKGGDIEDSKVTSADRMEQDEEIMSLKDSMDLKLNILIREWKKSTDVLFAVHPADGSLLTWTVEWLDDPLRQPIVSFTSRFPFAFSLSDATSLNPSLSVYYPHDFLYKQFIQKYSSDGISQIFEQRNTNLLHLLTHHNNGSLNLWNLTFEDNDKFNTVVNISHASRMCGHRYKISQVIAHPVLPLVLTTSHYNYITQDTEETGKAELILWKVNPVGPLCKSGGIRELARMTSDSSDAFTAVTWLPVILSGSLLGSLSTSPSSSFVANSSGHINIYQAIVDAAEFLADIHAFGERNASHSESSCSINGGKVCDIRNKQNMKRVGKVVSTQSSAKPGCILLLASINASSCADNVLLIHAFNEHLLVSKDDLFGITDTENLAIEKANINRYYLVLFEKEKDTLTRLRMWLINIAVMDFENPEKNDDALPVKDSLASANVKNINEDSFTKLQLTTDLIYNDLVVLPTGVSVISVEPSAGHLPSSNLYPTYRAPYLVLLACSDENVRFYECLRTTENNGLISFKWKMWKMISNTMNSNIEMDGQIYSISAAHSSRFACAYLPEGMSDTISSISSVKVGVFECESSGGVEWLREDTFIVNVRHRMSKKITENYLKRSDATVSGMPISNVCLKWVSAEDGSHILTVALGTYVFLYTQVSQGAAQRNIVMMKEHDTHRRGPLRKASSLANPETISTRLVRWLCIRFLELKSADGLPPLPTTLGWVGDGLLIIGMQSEMRCYSQWNFKAEFPKKKRLEGISNGLSKLKPSSHLALASLGITSHSSLDQLSKKSKQEPVPLNKQKLYKDLLQRIYSVPHDLQTLLLKDEHVLEAISEEGLFEAARLASPILPQYHPKLLIELLNSGRTRMVKAILLHVLKSLKQLNVSIPNPLSRASSIRRMSFTTGDLKMETSGQEVTRGFPDTVDDSNLEYDELDGIPPLPLHILLSAGDPFSATREKTSEIQDGSLDGSLDMDGEPKKSRQNSLSMDNAHTVFGSTSFTARHNRLLTEFLTHIHLPGLSSVDQMHLLAVADTLSHFSSDIMDKLTQANAAFQATQPRIIGDAGYAASTVGFETVDECGLRYLMAMKQHEYLLLCLPLQQKRSLRSRGLLPSQFIWALHSETETELLNAIPCLQKPTLSWEELRALGVAWWLKNTSSLRVIIEKLAKAAFQKNQDPLDASLYYLLMKKKNLLTHLFKTVKDNRMLDFFMHDFNEEKWKKAALKNAFVLMGKQRFQHAAAFFLLAGSVKDAIQIVLRKLQDLQLAIVIVRLCEKDYEDQGNLLRELLCREIFGIEVMNVKDFDVTPRANRNPFIRSMAYWHLKEYVRAANTLVDEASRVHLDTSLEYSLSDIFNFYSFIRIHHLVVRQKLLNAGIQIGSTEKFLAVAKHLASVITPSERRLYFRTASAHMASGCPLLALDVLARLPKNLTIVESSSLSLAINRHARSNSPKNDDSWDSRSNVVDWSAPVSSVHVDEELNLQLNDSETEDEVVVQKENIMEVISDDSNREGESNATLDVIAQHMKFTATLRLLVEELSTLANAFEVDGGQLRFQLFNWLEAGVNVLRKICSCRDDHNSLKLDDNTGNKNELNDNLIGYVPLCEILHMDKVELSTRFHYALHRQRWLRINQKLLRAFISYCILHNSQSHRLTAALMELLLLLMETQQNSGPSKLLTGESLPMVHSFPLFIATISTHKMFASSPLSFVKNLCSDILLSLIDFSEPPQIESSLTKVYKVYSLCQGLSSCLYQSLCDVNNIYGDSHGALARLSKATRTNDDLKVTTSPSKWPGVNHLLEVLSREKDEGAAQLRLLMLETYIAVFASLFAYALATYDARWLFRLAARNIGTKEFAILFGGGGGETQKIAPSKPAGLPVKRMTTISSGFCSNEISTKFDKNYLSIDSSSFRDSCNTEVIGGEAAVGSADGYSTNKSKSVEEQSPCEWVSPKKSMVQFFAEKPESPEILSGCCDSDEEHDESVVELEEQLQRKQHNDSEGFAWRLLRLALTHQVLYRMKSFLQLAGLEYSELPALSPRANAVFKLIENWAKQLEEHLYAMPSGCPPDLLPDLSIRKSDSSAELPLKKYSVLMETNNTPFQCANPSMLPVKRIWLYLIRQDHILPLFIKHIFGFGDQQEENILREGAVEFENRETLNIFKIVQREHEPIAAFCCSEIKPGWLVVSNTRELQEIDITTLLDDAENQKLSSWLFNRTELDVALDGTKRDMFKDNDDYQLLTENGQQTTALTTMYKRQVNGIRRLDSHPTMPYYISGSSDGSIRLWEWGVGQPFFTPRIAGQYAKVTKVLFSYNGSKFASVDNDGILCLWQTTQGLPIKKPFFNQKCHSKSAADVRFLGFTSSVLVTAGLSFSDENISLWDTLMPQSKALVHSWTTHPEGATSVMYLSPYQTIVSGGRHGELCVWDVRQRRLRTTVKCFENSSVKCLVGDPFQQIIVAGSNDGDIKIWNTDLVPLLMASFDGEHIARGGFSLRQVASVVQAEIGYNTLSYVFSTITYSLHYLIRCKSGCIIFLNKLKYFGFLTNTSLFISIFGAVVQADESNLLHRCFAWFEFRSKKLILQVFEILSMDDPCERTCYVCNLHENVTEELLRELFSQVGPLDTIILRTSSNRDCSLAHRYALIVFKHEALKYRTNISLSALHNSISCPSITQNHANNGLFDACKRRQNEREEHYQKSMRDDKSDVNIFTAFTASYL